jgi:hypothetical protein
MLAREGIWTSVDVSHPPAERWEASVRFGYRLISSAYEYEVVLREPLLARSRRAGKDRDKIRRHFVRDRGNSDIFRAACANGRKPQEPSHSEEVLATDLSVRAMTARNTSIIGP